MRDRDYGRFDIEKENIELIVENDAIADCSFNNVFGSVGLKKIVVRCLGKSVGTTSFYVKDRNSDKTSDIIYITVNEKTVPPEDNSRTVYLNRNGNKYHYSKSCAGKSAYATTLNKAKGVHEPCSKCVN